MVSGITRFCGDVTFSASFLWTWLLVNQLTLCHHRHGRNASIMLASKMKTSWGWAGLSLAWLVLGFGLGNKSQLKFKFKHISWISFNLMNIQSNNEISLVWLTFNILMAVDYFLKKKGHEKFIHLMKYQFDEIS